MLMISERKLINLLNIFNTELPKFFSPYQASEHMEWDYDKKKATTGKVYCQNKCPEGRFLMDLDDCQMIKEEEI